ncbi:hypothetical protein OXPF_23200 [Oxobacter pfennigii]|uniref:DUF6487 domain-containing protein n=1 Tax=Oxobacter pfennigii TaxID=36849 RepID=A0A0N8NT88_9CLOT|nr:PF20097 family protein [Oxobacter pfennigii]KPU44152.1 hypothetical protein OXPF_23200 [Oxobacter pfennigii]
MNCPYCGMDMEAGVIQSPHEINWLPKKHFFGRAEFHKGSIILSEFSYLRGSAAKAYLCRNCEKIVIDYKDGSCDLNKKNE